MTARRGAATRLALLAVVVVTHVLLLATPASAHPLGNFTVNRYARLELSAGVVRVLYVLDLAEIPAFQERMEVAEDPDAFALDRAQMIGRQLGLVVDGEAVPLELMGQELEQPPGQGGLKTLRLTALYAAEVDRASPGQVREVIFTDGNEPDRLGWREIVVTPVADAEVLDSDAPAEGVSDELRAYPEDRISSPLDQRRARVSYTEGSVRADPPALDGSGESVLGGDGFAALVTRTDLTPVALLGLLALALGFGAVHAVGPGHGKTVMAAYLVSTRGRPRDAVLLGGIVSLMHTASVLVLGAVLLQVDRSIATEAAYPILTLVSGVAVTAVGGWLLIGRWRRLRAGGRNFVGHHHHGGEHHSHDLHEGSHGAGGHSHDLPADVAPLSKRGLIALGTSGGLFPSPSAVLVMVGAVGLGRAGLGLALLAAFSVGLAATLTVVGLGLVYGRALIERGGHTRRLRSAPVVGAVALILLGVVVAVRAVVDMA
ncbi:hypothetical protein BH24ACT1_BH24ACT1_13300 [soil metagenome]